MPTEHVPLDGDRTLCAERFGRVEGKPVLYFHGLPGSRLELVWADSLLHEAGLTVVAVDRPGFGGSSFLPGRALLDWPQDVEALADRLGLERFAVVGYSSGGKYAIACASSLPERVTLAGLVSGTGPPEIPGFRAGLGGIDRISLTLASRARPLALALWGAVRRMALGRPDRFAAQFEKELSEADRAVLADPAIREALLRAVREGLRPGAAGVVEDYAVEARAWGFALDEIRVPVRIWHGDADHVVPLEHSRYLAARIPTARLTVMEGAGHILRDQLDPLVRELANGGVS
jgi:pimeloyl-ACP methyl ester carboxylesterase